MYTVKFLDSESFDNLPYNKVGTSLGVADRNKGVAYVRDTGDPLMIFNAYHELEHLKGDDLGEHESPGEDGVYYKGFGQMFDSIGGTLAPILGSIIGGPIGGAAASGMQNFAGGIVNKSGRKDAANRAMESQQQQQPAMQQFTPSMPTQAQAAAPATSAIGGGQGGGMEGAGMGQGAAGKIRSTQQLVQDFSRSKGFYGGR